MAGGRKKKRSYFKVYATDEFKEAALKGMDKLGITPRDVFNAGMEALSVEVICDFEDENQESLFNE